jgi:hypothetical protein
MPHWENKVPQPKHGTLQRATPLPPKDNDTLKGPRDVQKIKSKQEPRGGLRTKEGKVSIVSKEKGE